MQNAILRGVLLTEGIFGQDADQLWINVKKTGGKWYIAGSQPLTDFESDWADGEPNPNEGDCAIMDKSIG